MMDSNGFWFVCFVVCVFGIGFVVGGYFVGLGYVSITQNILDYDVHVSESAAESAIESQSLPRNSCWFVSPTTDYVPVSTSCDELGEMCYNCGGILTSECGNGVFCWC